jgi:hypothetical protein
MRTPLVIFLIVLCEIASGAALAQTPFSRAVSSETPDLNISLTGFDRTLSTYLWTNTTLFASRIGKDSLRVEESFRSTLTKFDMQNIRDENNLKLFASRQVNSVLSAVVQASSFLLSDSRDLLTNQALTGSLLAGVSYSPLPELELVPLIGGRYDRQLSEADKGLSYAVTARLNHIDWPTFDVQAFGTAAADFINPRLNESRSASVSLLKTFPNTSTIGVALSYENLRRDFYFTADKDVQQFFGVSNNIEQRTENKFSILTTLNYQTQSGFSGGVQLSLREKAVAARTAYKPPLQAQSSDVLIYDTDVSEQELAASFNAAYRKATAGTSVSFSYLGRDEEHSLANPASYRSDQAVQQAELESRKSNITTIAVLSDSSYLNFFSGSTLCNRVLLAGSIHHLSYDTPDTTNTDDHDELTFLVTLSDEHYFTEHFSAKLSAFAILTHTVYIFADQSGNNAWNRVIRLQPSTRFSVPDWLDNYAQIEVLANFTAYDYDTGSGTRSFSFRQFALLDSSKIFLSSVLTLNIVYEQRLYEQAELNWQAFSERPLSFYNERTMQAEFSVKVRNFIGSFGVRTFLQRRFVYGEGSQAGEKILDAEVYYYGPVCRLRLDVMHQTAVEAAGWYEFQKTSGQLTREIPNLNLTVKLNF